MRTNGTLNFLLGDHLGSTSLTTDASGNVISELRYKAWGEVRYASGTAPTKYQFTGQYSYASDFGLMFYNARWYDPSLGRFAQADTIVPKGVQGYDRYAYANNSPLNYIDPSGRDGECPPFLAGICEWFKSALSRWEEAKSLQCSMMLTGCPSYPTSPMDAVKKTAESYAASSWGGMTTEQLQQLDQTLDIVQRVAAISNLLRSSTDRADFSNIEGADPSQIDQMVPLDWSVEHDPFYDQDGNFIDQWVYTSPNGQEQLRLHQPIPAYGGTSWQARWGNQVDESVYDYLGPSYVQKFTNNGKAEYWIYFDDHGNIMPLRSDDVHIPIKNGNNK